jgi:topoisomerase-4 subunit A
VRAKSNERIYVLDSTGRSYSIDAHSLASARGQGDPLTSVLKPPAGASFEQLLTGADDQRIILASSAGYGFINTIGNLDSNQKAGKNIINLAADSRLLPVARIDAPAAMTANSENTEGENSTVSTTPDHVAVVTNAGYLLIFALDDLPEQARGKGNKLIKLKDSEEVLAITPLSQQDSLIITAGKRHVTLKPNDLANYTGSRGNRGGQLPRGFQNVTSVEVG